MPESGTAMTAASPMKAIAQGLGIQDQRIVDALCEASTMQRFSKGSTILARGHVPASIPFVTAGIARSYFYTEQGEDVTSCIIDRPSMPAITTADLTAPSIEAVEALTDCETLMLDIRALRRLMESSIDALLVYAKVVGDAWASQRTLRFVTSRMSARQRYLWFLDEYPGVIDEIAHRHVASFLSMTPVTLARVRRGLANEAHDSN